MYSNRLIRLAIFVPALGLISCSQEPRGEDSWKLSAPQIKVPGLEKARPFSDSNRNFEVGSTLQFDSNQVKDVTFEIETNCDSNRSNVVDKITIQNADSIPIASLLPRQIWNLADTRAIEASICTSQFRAINKTGSTHSFQFNGFKLSNLANSVKPQFTSAERVLAASVTSEIPLDSNFQNEVVLVCENFSSLRSYGVGKDAKRALVDLAQGRVMDPNNPAAEVRVDPRLEKTLQSCALVTRSEDNSTGLPTFATTSHFTMEFPHPKARVVVDPRMGKQVTASHNSIVVYSFPISNPNAQKLLLRIPLQPSGAIGINGVLRPQTGSRTESSLSPGYARTNTFWTDTAVASANFQVSVPAENTGSHLIFDLQPGATAEIRLVVSTRMQCWFAWDLKALGISEETILKTWAIAGFETTLKSPIGIQYLREFHTGKAVRDEWVDQQILQAGVHWQPHAYYEKKTGRKDRPETTAVITDPITQGSLCIDGPLLSRDPNLYY